jgi:exoribonuclease-2
MSTEAVKHPGAGCIVEFMQGDRPQTAFVLDESGGKFRVLTPTKREMKLPSGRILPWAGPCLDPDASREVALNALAERDKARVELAAAVDAMEIWELAQGEVEQASIEWFAGLVFDDVDADRLAAVGRALIERKTHFKFRPPKFEVYPEEKARARLEEERRARERREIIDAGRPFFQALYSAWSSGRPAPPGPDNLTMAEKLKSLLLGAMAEDPETMPLWNELSKGLPESPNLAFLLARTWGLVSEHHNMQMAREGYQWGDDWSEPFETEIAEIAARFENPGREPEPPELVSIDSASTRDVDDAFHLRETPDGFHLRLALAAPALGWNFEGPLDAAVRERSSSLYLPEGTCHMLPERLASDACSLKAGEPRPALVLDFSLDSDMRPTGLELSQRTVVVAENATYEQAEERIGAPEPDPMLAAAYELAELLRERRVENGAAVIVRPDPKILLSQEDGRDIVNVTLPHPCPKAHLLVSEMMILANTHAARWALERGASLFFRTQDIQLPPEAAGVWENPEDAFQVVKLMGPTILDVEPARHASLGVSAYSPVTSPLRRYTDLMNQAQLMSLAATGRPRWSKAELTEALPYLSARVEAAGRIQRFRPRYWKLVFLKQRREEFFDAVVVDSNRLVTASLPLLQIYVRAPKDVFGEKIRPGQPFRVKMEKVHPLENEMRVAEAWEK